MKKSFYSSRWMLICLMVTLALIAAQCGGAAAPTEPPAPAVEEEAVAPQPAEEEKAAPAEEEATEEEAAPAEEAAEAPAEEEQPDVAEKVVESKSSQELNLGVSVTTDEPDVSSLRDNQGGEYKDVGTTDAVSFHPYLTSDGASAGR